MSTQYFMHTQPAELYYPNISEESKRKNISSPQAVLLCCLTLAQNTKITNLQSTTHTQAHKHKTTKSINALCYTFVKLSQMQQVTTKSVVLMDFS